MNLGIFTYTEMYHNNQLFNNAVKPAGGVAMHCYESIYPFVRLKERLEEMGHKVSTLDTGDLDSFDIILFIDFPGVKNLYFKSLIKRNFKNMYLLLRESEMHNRDNINKIYHRYFKKIFTWHKGLIDNKKYFRIFNSSHVVPEELQFGLQNKKKLCAFIGGHKRSDYPSEMYSERIKAIRWFEKNHPEDFDLYGIGWDKYQLRGWLSRANGRINAVNNFIRRKTKIDCLEVIPRLLKGGRPLFPSYRGVIPYEKEILPKYKFSICYQNFVSPGWIGERIFYCLVSGCVPIYLGAPDITDYVPADTFVDKRDFKTYEELYAYIKNIPESEYVKYLNNIAGFLKSDKHYKFSADYFAKTLSGEILKDLGALSADYV